MPPHTPEAQALQPDHDVHSPRPQSVAYARAMREVVARRIIDMAQRGIRDQKELANGALRFLAANYRLERKRRPGSSGMAVAPLALHEITAADGGKKPSSPRIFWHDLPEVSCRREIFSGSIRL